MLSPTQIIAEELGGKTVVQHFMSMVEKIVIYSGLVTTDTNEVVDLMFTHPVSVDLLRIFHMY